jgi:hypothetical protein
LGIQGKRSEDYFASQNRDYSTTVGVLHLPLQSLELIYHLQHLPSPPLTPNPTETLPKMVSGARVCAMRGCGHILPSATEYCWNLCEPCRTRMRRGKKHRKTKVPASADAEYDIGLPIHDQTQGGKSEGIPPVSSSDKQSEVKAYLSLCRPLRWFRRSWKINRQADVQVLTVGCY